MHCTEFGSIWPSSSKKKEVKNVKKLQIDRRTTDNRGLNSLLEHSVQVSWKGIKNHTVYTFLVSVAIVIFKHHIFKNFNLYNRHLLITIIYFASANICTYYGMFGKIFKISLFFFTKTVIRIGFHILTNYRQRLFQFYAGEYCLTIIEFESWWIFFFQKWTWPSLQN